MLPSIGIMQKSLTFFSDGLVWEIMDQGGSSHWNEIRSLNQKPCSEVFHSYWERA